MLPGGKSKYSVGNIQLLNNQQIVFIVISLNIHFTENLLKGNDKMASVILCPMYLNNSCRYNQKVDPDLRKSEVIKSEFMKWINQSQQLFVLKKYSSLTLESCDLMFVYALPVYLSPYPLNNLNPLKYQLSLIQDKISDSYESSLTSKSLCQPKVILKGFLLINNVLLNNIF